MQPLMQPGYYVLVDEHLMLPLPRAPHALEAARALAPSVPDACLHAHHKTPLITDHKTKLIQAEEKSLTC